LFEDGKYPIKSIKEISNCAIETIIDVLRGSEECTPTRNVLYCMMTEIGSEWTNKLGNWPKRFAKVLKKNGYKASNDLLSKVGKVARESCITVSNNQLIVTSDFDWKPGDYGDHDSCFWTCRSAARYIISKLGGKALLIHGANNDPKARAWCIPYNDPKFIEEAHVIFNVYSGSGEHLNIVSFARIFSDIFNRSYYRNVDVSYMDDIEGALWINNGRGYIVGAQEVSDCEAVDFKYRITCTKCGRSHPHTAVWHGDDIIVCGECEDGQIACYECGRLIRENDAYYEHEESEDPFCEDCFTQRFTKCQRCPGYADRENCHTVKGEVWCHSCFDGFATHCDFCSGWDDVDRLVPVMGKDREELWLCGECCEGHALQCDACGKGCLAGVLTKVGKGYYVCPVCLDQEYTICVKCGVVSKNDGHDDCSVCRAEREKVA